MGHMFHLIREEVILNHVFFSSAGLGQNVFIKIAALANLRAKSSRKIKLKTKILGACSVKLQFGWPTKRSGTIISMTNEFRIGAGVLNSLPMHMPMPKFPGKTVSGGSVALRQIRKIGGSEDLGGSVDRVAAVAAGHTPSTCWEFFFLIFFLHLRLVPFRFVSVRACCVLYE